MDYLPKDATIEEACAWLQAKTGQTWVLARLLECHLTPFFWLDYKPGYPQLFGNRVEGYQTRMIFQGDLSRLESDRSEAMVTMFPAHDGTLVKLEPGMRVPLSELKFKRESIERVAEIINKTVPLHHKPSAEPNPNTGTAPKLSDQQKAEIKQLYARGHGESVNSLAKRFQVSRPIIDKVLKAAGVKI